jgi:lipoprotein-anchoring transpeptidase ErfK/SrfK
MERRQSVNRRCVSTLIRTIPAAILLVASASLMSRVQETHAASSHAAAYKHITVNVVRERLRAWEGKTVVLVTPVTTGDRTLPTPTGYFRIYAKYSPYTMISPWPRGDWRWYPPSSMSFAMEFANGYFIHDAPWRSVYGPGSNSGTQPGTNYGGTHGCVNVPYSAMRFLYSWASPGTLVHIVR